MLTTTKNLRPEGLTAIIYGESGSGKTTLASTLKEPTLIINFENGLLSLREFKIDVYDCTVDKDGNDLSRDRRFKKQEYFFDKVYPDIKNNYKNIFIDSLTEMSQNLIEHLKTIYDESNGFKLWGAYNDYMTFFVKRMRDLHCNVWILALDAVDKDDLGRRFTGLDIAGKISNRLPALVDEIFYLKTESDESKKLVRKLQTSKIGNVLAKDRSGKLDIIEDANLQNIINKIQGVKK
jgi:energy-coupling factor transporter ATP-binding protein EcfA2